MDVSEPKAARGLALKGPRSPRYACIVRQVLGRVQNGVLILMFTSYTHIYICVCVGSFVYTEVLCNNVSAVVESIRKYLKHLATYVCLQRKSFHFYVW